MPRHTRTWGLLVVVAGLAIASGLRAQEPETPADYMIQTEEEFLKLPPNTPAGTLISVVYLKFGKLFGDQLKLHASQIPDQRLVVRNQALVDRLNLVPPTDSEGQKLVPRRSNIQILGVVSRKGAELTVEVNRIRLLETDEQWFARRMNQLSDNDPQKFIALAYEVSARTKLIEDEQERAGLSRLIRALSDRARKIEQAQLDPLPGGADAWIRFGRRYKDIDPLVQVWTHKAVPEPLRKQAEQALRQLNAHMYLGQWYGYEAFKAQLGLVQVQDGGETRWVDPERAAFLKAIDEEKKKHQGGVPDFGLFEDSVLVQEASRGNLIRGMRKHHVLQVRRGGELGESWLPVRVDRLRERYDQGTITWEQWVMPDGTRVYFYNTIVISKEG